MACDIFLLSKCDFDAVATIFTNAIFLPTVAEWQGSLSTSGAFLLLLRRYDALDEAVTEK